MLKSGPRSCDTFVVLPPGTANDHVVFGKNSDRPCEEVQEVIYVAPADFADGEKLQCTYIEIDQVAHTHAVILSKPSWMWGAEMGANSQGVCIGNEAVWTKLNGPDDLDEKLLGMDIVRLGLERGSTAREALDAMTGLLDKYGQGGPCSDDGGDWAYHNSFLIADGKEAWVLETAGHLWAAEHVTSGVRNISNELSIRTKIDLMSSGLKEEAQKLGFYSPDDGPLDFAKAFSSHFLDSELTSGHAPHGRAAWGRKLLEDFSKEGFSAKHMLQVLRHEESGICMTGSFLTTGSQVSVLTASAGAQPSPCCHWFTATPNPNQSIFKPFFFGTNINIGDQTTSPTFKDDPAKVKPRFKKSVDRRYPLYKAQENMRKLLDSGDPKGKMMLENAQMLEGNCVGDVEDMMKMFDERSSHKVAEIFKHMVDLEMNFYHSM